ncbi:MAG: FlgD immunoglobulin-like domain containing protein, partial [Gammaproteobacteria bacterium]|nr:FlgD immunoglobulin-like domain containing protein [Gammaproteobacteria bacterium]
MKLKSRHDVQISIESNQGADGQELVIEDGEKELLLRLGQEVRLESGDRYLSLYIRPMNPQVSQVLQNYPNPFNPETWIPYQLSQEAAVSLQIYDGQGRLVRKLELGWKEAGYYTTAAEAIYWDGRNANGESVSSGLYFYRLQAGDYSQTRKMVILK